MKTRKNKRIDQKVRQYYQNRGIEIRDARVTKNRQIVVRFDIGKGPAGLKRLMFQHTTARRFLS